MPSSIKLRAGLVGAGYISEYHVAALKRLPSVELVGLCDVDPARASAAAEKFGIRAFASLSELHEAGAGVIHILTPPHTHGTLAVEALDLGCHVLVEKPLATDMRDCWRIERKAQERSLQVCVNHSLLFDPHVRGALDMVKSGKIGRVVSVDILRSSVYPPFSAGPLPPQYRTAGYPFRDLGVHALYLFEAFLGPIQNVTADWTSLGGEPNLAFDEWRAQVRSRDGLGQCQLSWNVKPLQNQLIVHGTKGVVRVDLFSMFHSERRSTPLPKAAERILNAFGESLQPLIQVPINVAKFALGRIRPYQGLQDLVAEFYRSLAHNRPVPVPVSQAMRVVDWTERIARLADEDHARHTAKVTPPTHAQTLVTGASGALGSAVVNRLRSQGKRVRILVRRVPQTPDPAIEVVLGDLGDPDAVDRAVKGVQCVIHCGAAMKGGWPDHERATIGGTRNVLESCRTHGIKKLVHISSFSVLNWAGARKNALLDESSPLERHAQARGHYTRAKLEAERLVSQCCRDFGLPTVILRPGQIFGGGIPVLTPAVARKLGRRWLILGNGRIRLPLVYIENVVDSILSAAQSPLQDGQILHIVDKECPTQNELLTELLGNKARVIRLPRFMVFLLGKFSELPFALLRRPSPLALYRLRSALARRSFSYSRAQELLQWQPSYALDAALAHLQNPQPTPTPAAEPFVHPHAHPNGDGHKGLATSLSTADSDLP